MKRIAILLAALLIVSTLASCGTASAPEETITATPPVIDETQESPDTPDTTPPEIIPPPDKWELADLWARIDGSTATIPLTAELYNVINGGGAFPPEHSMTSGAYYNLIYGHSDLIFVTYPSEEEFAMARENGVELEIIPVTKDALVYLVNAENPVENLSLTQLRDIYTGKTTSWSDVDGTNEAIIPYQRPVKSGSQTLFLKLVMDGITPMDPPTEWVKETMGALVESVSNYDNAENAVGYSMFYYVNNMYGNSRFKLLAVDGVKPTRDTITRGEYPLEDYYYAVMRKDTPEESLARLLVDWLLTDSGQAVAIKAGYIPLRPITGAEPDDAIDPVYLGDTENSSGTGGTELKTGDEVTDAVNASVRKPLSDMFYDGFNYVEYINGFIMAQLDEIDREFFNSSWGEKYLIRPFTGIPSNYPHYELYASEYGSYINIELPEGNPFFGRAMSFSVHLTTDISPYGIITQSPYTVTFDYARRMLPRVDLFTLSVDIPDAPGVSASINKQLREWESGFENDAEAVAQLEGFLKWCESVGMYGSPDYAYSFQPLSGLWRDYLSVYYVLHTYDGPSSGAPMLFCICFDIKTGEVVNLAEKLPRNMDFTKSFAYPPTQYNADGTTVNSEGMPEGYVPPEGYVISNAYGGEWGFTVIVTEPGGREVQVHFWDGIE